MNHLSLVNYGIQVPRNKNDSGMNFCNRNSNVAVKLNAERNAGKGSYAEKGGR